jgi:sugar phosphate isomerase/epimerase
MSSSVAGFRYSVSEFSTPHNSFMADLAQFGRTGATGIGLWEGKLDGEERAAAPRLLSEAGLTATFCVPAVWSFLPSALSPEPSKPEARVDAMVKSIEWMAGLEPAAMVVTPGSYGDLEPAKADAAIEEGLSHVVSAAARSGVLLAFEPVRRGAVSTFSGSLALLNRIGASHVRVLVDVWHLWDEPGLHQLLESNIDRVAGIQVNDWREPTRGWTDRALPGEGNGALRDVLATAIRAGFDGWYDLEVFSDDGTYVADYPDSLWHLPHEEMLGRAYEGFARSWEQARRDAMANAE